MDFKTLQMFTAVVEAGSISGAARQLHSVQSNISARILQLEEQLGATLFVREARGIRLTPAGETLNSYVQRILSLREEAIEAVTASTQGKGMLRLGTMESTLAIRLPDLLQKFTTRYPDIDLDIHTGTTDRLLDDMFNYRLDGALIGGDIKSDQVHSRPVFDEEIVLITPSSIDSVDQALNKKLVVFRQGCAYRAFAEQWLREQGMSPIRITELGTLDGIFSCISAGIGVTCLPRSVAEQHHMKHHLNIHPIEDQRARISINLITHAELSPHPALLMLFDLAE